MWWPLAVLNWSRGLLRNRLFDLGIWKSVEFEVPVVFVGSLADDPTIAISRYLQQLLKGTLHVDGSNVAKYHLEKVKDDSVAYLNPLNTPQTFCTKHKVLGLSEWYQCNPRTPAFVMDDAYSPQEIRPQFRLLITDYSRPFTQDALYPIGKLQESIKGMNEADAILVYNSPDQGDYKKIEKDMMPYLKKGSLVFFIRNSINALNAFNSTEEIEFISDRSNFERLILNILPNANPDSE
ncbi:tetraacyldisaccharide 4'-kinase [Reichenbachiella sp.]|uniref:tetraacyldisaccharide 4'-kinase n=1 Tax=Reichenbachiella sp. TaxID=2184521 RepID=UPI003B5CB571